MSEPYLDELFISCNEKGWDNVVKLCSLKEDTKSNIKIYLSGIKGIYEPKKIKGADGVSISYPHNWGGKMDFKGEGLRDPCKLLWTNMYVTWQGKVIICCMDYEAEYEIGDASKEFLWDIWQRFRRHKFRLFHKLGQFDKMEICKDCLYNYHNKNSWWV